ncbi:MAG: hypothetical protein AAGJ70_05085 [Pseudomonadota bacterium]
MVEATLPDKGFSEEGQRSIERLDDLVGQFRTFGEYGPTYKVLRIISDTHAHIIVPVSGEELDYEIEKIRSHPLEV